MGKLIRSNFCNLVKCIPYYIALIMVVCLSTVLVSSLVDYEHFKPFPSDLISAMVSNETVTALIILAVVPFVIGADFDGGMIRNKIVAGFSKGTVFFSSFITAWISVMVITIVSVSGCVLTIIKEAGFDVVKSWFTDSGFVKSFWMIVLFQVLVFTALTAAGTAVTMICTKKGVAVIGSLIVFFIGGMFSGVVREYATATQPYFIYYNDNNEEVKERNPYYLEDGTFKKNMYIATDSFNVIYQVSDPPIFIDEEYYESMDEDSLPEFGITRFVYPTSYIIGDVAFIAVAYVIGVLVFKKRNLK